MFHWSPFRLPRCLLPWRKKRRRPLRSISTKTCRTYRDPLVYVVSRQRRYSLGRGREMSSPPSGGLGGGAQPLAFDIPRFWWLWHDFEGKIRKLGDKSRIKLVMGQTNPPRISHATPLSAEVYILSQYRNFSSWLGTITKISFHVREAAKKRVLFLVVRPLRREGGLRAWPLRKKKLFFIYLYILA